MGMKGVVPQHPTCCSTDTPCADNVLAAVVVACEIKCRKARVPFEDHQECGFACLVSQCSISGRLAFALRLAFIDY
eukprot:2160838-Rhodomonas_salina.3